MRDSARTMSLTSRALLICAAMVTLSSGNCAIAEVLAPFQVCCDVCATGNKSVLLMSSSTTLLDDVCEIGSRLMDESVVDRRKKIDMFLIKRTLASFSIYFLVMIL
jgi:hypothetical protein